MVCLMNILLVLQFVAYIAKVKVRAKLALVSITDNVRTFTSKTTHTHVTI